MLRSIYRFLSPKWQNAFLDYKVNLRPRYGENKKYKANPFLIDLFKKNEREYSQLLKKFLNFQKELSTIPLEKENEISPYWQNEFLPGMDVISLYIMCRLIKPSTYLEIGSGHSTKIAHKAKLEGKLNMKIVSIDPYPRSEIDQLADKIIRRPVEGLSFDNPVFESLKKGDILFIDSSHRILPNSDCAFIYTELIPSLPSGVIIHIHDIYLPYDYPQFMCDRFYNENEFLASYLLSNPNYFDILLPNYYIFQNQELWKGIAPLFSAQNMAHIEKHGGSIWLMKK